MANRSAAHLLSGETVKGDQRRQTLTLIAYHTIAEKGFEGLRVRDIAAQAQINIATLHYYFPTKEDLIRSVVAYLSQEFSKPRVPTPDNASPLERLRLEFADVEVRLRESHAMFVVLSELFARSVHDPAIAHILTELMNGWQAVLADIVQQGVTQGVFRADLDVPITAAAIQTMILGLTPHVLCRRSWVDMQRIMAEIAAQVEHWLLLEPQS